MSFFWGSPTKATKTKEEIEQEKEKEKALARQKDVHESVWCDGCASEGKDSKAKALVGLRVKCLVCPNIDMCRDCFFSGKTPQDHSSNHEVLCFPLAAPDVLVSYAFPNLTCHYCARKNFYGSCYTCASCPINSEGSTPVWCEACKYCPKSYSFSSLHNTHSLFHGPLTFL